MSISQLERAPWQAPDDEDAMSDTVPTFRHKPLADKHVGHASTHVRVPRPLTREELSRLPELPDELKGLQVTEYRDHPNETAVQRFAELGPVWAKQGLTAKAMVSELQWETQEMLNTQEIMNVRGWAEQMIAQGNGDPMPVRQPTPPEIPDELPIPSGTSLVEKYLQDDGTEGYRVVSYEERMKRKMGQSILNEEMRNG